jgi:hypothetical protein
MPDRIVREGILDSDKVNALSWAAEVFYRRLFSLADDFGRYDSRVNVLRARLYPTKIDKVSDMDVVKWLGECQKAGLVSVYQVGDKSCLEIQEFGQRLRAMKSKYPAPSADSCQHSLSNDSNRMRTSVETNRNEFENESTNGAPPAPPPSPPVGKVKKTRENFVPPTQEQMRAYFLKLMKEKWGEAKCCNEADSCLDHYAANGWVQNKGKPVVDWMAAARNWIRRDLDGDFAQTGRPAAKQTSPSAPLATGAPTLSKTQVELNYLYAIWLEDPAKVTVISIQPEHYNYLKAAGSINFTPPQVLQIQKAARGYIVDHQLEGSDKEMALMKKFGVLEFFKTLKANGASQVYTP